MVFTKSKICLLIISSFISNIVVGQYWKTKSFEGIYGLGISNLMADVGATYPATSGPIGEYFWIRPQSFRLVLWVGGRYFYNDRMAVKSNLIVSHLSAADIYTDYQYRNLITNLFLSEISVQYEYYLNKEKAKKNYYRLKSYKWYKNMPWTSYFFIGIGETFFISKTKINKRYINNPKYKRHYIVPTGYKHQTPVIPFGIGAKFWLNKKTRFGIEAGYRFSFSDYLDEKTTESDNWPDSYQFILFSLNYKLKTGRNGLPLIRSRY